MRIPTVLTAAFLAVAPSAAFATAEVTPQPASKPKMTLLAQSANGQQKRYQACVRRVYRKCVRNSHPHAARYCIYRARAACSQ